jgi:hypothetical protein
LIPRIPLLTTRKILSTLFLVHCGSWSFTTRCKRSFILCVIRLKRI